MMRRIRHLLAALGALVVIVTATPLLEGWIQLLTGPWRQGTPDSILIVLAADAGPEGLVGYSSYWRAIYAARAWRQGKFREIVISGDRPASDPMRRFLVAEGVPAHAIQLEQRSLSTRENAVYTATLLRSRTEAKVLLTSDLHMRRASRAFARAGLTVIPYPIPDAGKRITQWPQRWWVFLDLCRETTKFSYYFARGWI